MFEIPKNVARSTVVEITPARFIASLITLVSQRYFIGDLKHGVGSILTDWRLNFNRFKLMNFVQLIQKLGYGRSSLASTKIHQLIKKVDIHNDADRFILVINNLRLLQTRVHNFRKVIIHISYCPSSHNFKINPSSAFKKDQGYS